MKTLWMDVTRPLRHGEVTWPGDPATEVVRVAGPESGSPAVFSRLSMSSHAGTHVDAPLHYLPEGAAADRMPLDACVGRARVIEVAGPGPIDAADLRAHAPRRGERLLIRTRTSPILDRTSPRFRPDYVSLAEDAAALLASLPVRLVGIDAPSVGAFEGGEATHRALLRAGIFIVEGLDLSGTPPGRYQMVCLPLRVEGCDGAPARVLLRPIARRAGHIG